MSEAQPRAAVSAHSRSFVLVKFVVWLSVGVLVGAEVFGAALAAAWAVGGLLEVSGALQLILYVVASVAALAVMVPFMRRAAQVEPFLGESRGGIE